MEEQRGSTGLASPKWYPGALGSLDPHFESTIALLCLFLSFRRLLFLYALSARPAVRGLVEPHGFDTRILMIKMPPIAQC